MDDKTPLQVFQEGLRTITVLGVKLYIAKWHDNIIETYLAPSEFWHTLSPELNQFNSVLDGYVDDSTIPRKIKITRQRRPMSIFPIERDIELADFKYARKLFYIYILPGT